MLASDVNQLDRRTVHLYTSIPPAVQPLLATRYLPVANEHEVPHGVNATNQKARVVETCRKEDIVGHLPFFQR